jgi:RNA polymerase sigma factor (sigma-70 family)
MITMILFYGTIKNGRKKKVCNMKYQEIKKIVNSIIKDTPIKDNTYILQDLYQEAYIAYLGSLESYKEGLNTTKRTWAGTCIYGAIIGFLRKEFLGFRQKNLIFEAYNKSFKGKVIQDEINRIQDPNDYYREVEDNDFIEKSLNVCTEKQKEVIRKYIYEDLTFDEISDILGKARSTPRGIFNTAIKNIKEKINE